MFNIEAILKFFKNRKLLRYLEYSEDQITSLDLNKLKQQNIKALIIDFDGVLAAESQPTPLPEAISWLEQAIEAFGVNKIFIFSNNPTIVRQQFFEKYFNNHIIFIIAKPKPDIEGLSYAFNYLQKTSSVNIEKSQILMLDDRLATGILAAKIFGIASCLIQQPYVNLKNNFAKELFYIVIRRLERLTIWLL